MLSVCFHSGPESVIEPKLAAKIQTKSRGASNEIQMFCTVLSHVPSHVTGISPGAQLWPSNTIFEVRLYMIFFFKKHSKNK